MPTIYRNKINYGGVTYLAGSGVTAGIITAYGGTTAPTGWLLCDGSAVSRETYSDLFKAIGTTYGTGDGSTTFNLPDLRKTSITYNNDLAQWIDISGYTSANPYTFPSDGYVFTYNAGSTTSAYTIVGSTDNGSTVAIGNTNSGRTCLFVKKGMKGYLGAGSFSAVRYSAISDTVPVTYIISIGQQGGGFTHIVEDSGTYNGGIEDEYLLTEDIIEDIDDLLES